MASSKPPCAACGNKGVGIFRCEGCLQVFCRKHLNEHRDALSHQLDEIVLEHDTLQQTICENTKAAEKQHPVLKQIDQWEKEAIQKIQRMAEELKQQVKELYGTPRISKQLRELAEQLQKARIDDDYVESDFDKWKATLQKLQDDLKDLFPMMYVSENSSQALVTAVCLSPWPMEINTIERFGETVGSVSIDERHLVATHCGPNNGPALVRGIGEYTNGVHTIRFLFEKRSLTFITSFEISPKLMPLATSSSVGQYYCYGWFSNDDIIAPDADQRRYRKLRDMNGETSFEIELQLDCDNRKVSCTNLRTKNRAQLKVDITKCPFPWQIRFYMYAVGDCVRLLP
ncbi:unnamed protein product [Adineta ricciae]|uniref:Uncharacterized protein n=1 Tax=Adineta ricciae TaxID=249248 RepID=A0A813WYH8_ADIRI|nr:unnamed protein product [Adineta ricciae]CAF0865168.1 unnamed protein product [Adineta ricciae]